MPLPHLIQDEDPYVRKTAAICVAKLYDINPDLVEERGFLDTLRELIGDSNPMVRRALGVHNSYSVLQMKAAAGQFVELAASLGTMPAPWRHEENTQTATSWRLSPPFPLSLLPASDRALCAGASG